MYNCTINDYCECDSLCYLTIASFLAFCGSMTYMCLRSKSLRRTYYVIEPKIEDDTEEIPPDYETSQIQSPPSYG